MQSATERRVIGTRPSAEGRYTRLVDKLVIYGDPLDFRGLCERVLSPKTRYLVLDLDRTFHLGYNMGELLGWELSAYWVYGEQSMGGPRLNGRFALSWNDPKGAARYLLRGARLWAYPGLLYLAFVKWGVHSKPFQRWLHLRLGASPVEVAQELTRMALLHQLSELPVETLRRLARQVWQRHTKDQVITREDLQWVREKCPGIRIIISSASPQPVLEAAAEALGVDDIAYTRIEEVEGYYSAPFLLRRAFLLFRRPKRIAPPSQVRSNAGYSKVESLLERYPDFCDPTVETVGITDTSHGEDHSWAQYFTKVADINSPTPFVPIVAIDSPLQEIHSAQVLTQGELEKRGKDQPEYLDRKRKRRPTFEGVKQYTADQLQELLSTLMPSVESLAKAYNEAMQSLGTTIDSIDKRAGELSQKIEKVVTDYNLSEGWKRHLALARLRHYLRQQSALRKWGAQQTRPITILLTQLSSLLEQSRTVLDRQSFA